MARLGIYFCGLVIFLYFLLFSPHPGKGLMLRVLCTQSSRGSGMFPLCFPLPMGKGEQGGIPAKERACAGATFISAKIIYILLYVLYNTTYIT